MDAAPLGNPRAVIARELPDEVRRQRLIDALALRWNVSLVSIEAPGGYGKTTALAQAIADNASDPSGRDVYVRCRQSHRTPEAFGHLVLTALGRGDHGREPIAHDIAAALAEHSPTDVCLHLDDLHQVGTADDVMTIVNDLIELLPLNAHLVLSARRQPAVPTSRLRASDELVVIDGSDLLFDEDELALLASHHGVDPAALSGLGGWPALTRLALVAGPQAPDRFVVEEIVDRLTAAERSALAVGALVGTIDQEMLRSLDLTVDLADLERRIPLVERTDPSVLLVHDLWGDSIDELVDRATRTELSTRVAAWLSEEGRHDEAITVAADVELWDVARSATLRALSSSDPSLSADLTGRWLARFPLAQRDEPELLFLRGVHERLSQGTGNGDDEVARAMDEFERRGQAEAEAVVACEYAVRGWLANDPAMVVEAIGRGDRLTGAGVGTVAPLQQMGMAVVTELGGDFVGALGILETIDLERLVPEFRELALRHASTLAFLCGEAERGVEVAERLAALEDSPRNRFVLATARFQADDPTPALSDWDTLRYVDLDNQRDDFLIALFSVMVDASFGRSPDAARVRALAWDRSREQCFVALAEAAAAIVAGDEAAAGARIEEAVERLGLDDPLVVGELRRFLPYGYVLSPTVREHIDRTESGLGPLHVRRLALARLLLALRSGTTPRWEDYDGPAAAICGLPLPWAVELAAGLADHDPDRAVELADRLMGVAGTAVHRELRRLRSHDGAGAATLLATLPEVPESPTTIEVCGSALTIDDATGRRVPTRGRVRQLLALLVLRDEITRDEAAAALWPDLDPRKARQNLTVNLTYARRELEPGRAAGEPPFHLRSDGDRLWLNRSPHLVVDAWEIRRRLDDAATSKRRGERGAALAAVERAALAGSLPMFADLSDVDGLRGDVVAAERAFARAILTHARSLLADDRIPEAIEQAERLLTVEPYDAGAHDVVIAAYLAIDDLDAAGEAIDECMTALGEAGIEPTPETAMLVKRHERRIEARAAQLRAS